MQKIVQTLFYIDFVYTYYNVSICGVLKGRFWMIFTSLFFQNLLNKRVNSLI